MMSELSRRAFLRGMAGAGAATVVVGLHMPSARAGRRPFSMATHIHASFSEGSGTMLAQLQQAKRNRVDVVWWTEHDFRMSGHGFWDELHLNGAVETDGRVALEWKDSSSGSFTERDALFVSDPVSPNDPGGSGSLRLRAVGSDDGFSFLRRWADTASGRLNLRGTMAGLTAKVDVFPESIGPDAFLEISFEAGYRPATAGRPAGTYSLSYRIGGPDPAGTVRAEGLEGVVVLPARTSRWQTVSVTPCEDIARLWPDLVAEDAGMCGFSLVAASRGGAVVAGAFDYVRFTRSRSADALDLQRELIAAYRSRIHGVRQYQGLEVSLSARHLNRYGGAMALPDYDGLPLLPVIDDPGLTRGLIEAIHDAGGVASYNHIFGTRGDVDPPDVQTSRARREAARLVSERLYGADLLEVGYRRYGGVELGHHLEVWDTCSRNSIFATGLGSSDDHSGRSWLTQPNNFVTWAWAESPSEADLLASMRSGRCFFSDLRRFRGRLDLVVDGSAQMGSISVSDETERELAIHAAGMPRGASLWLVQGPVDDAGPAEPVPGTIHRAIPSGAQISGRFHVAIDASAPTFVRAEVRDGEDRLIGGTNPVWLLREPPPGGIPADRRG